MSATAFVESLHLQLEMIVVLVSVVTLAVGLATRSRQTKILTSNPVMNTTGFDW